MSCQSGGGGGGWIQPTLPRENNLFGDKTAHLPGIHFPLNHGSIEEEYTLDIRNPPVIPGEDRCERNP